MSIDAFGEAFIEALGELFQSLNPFLVLKNVAKKEGKPQPKKHNDEQK